MGLMKAAYLEEEMFDPGLALKREEEKQVEYSAEEAMLRGHIQKLAERGLPIPRAGTPEISSDRLDVEALWLLLPVEDRDRIGTLALGMLVGAVISGGAKEAAPAAEAAGRYYHERCLDQLLDLSGIGAPPLIMDALKGRSWRLPLDIGPTCHSCGRFGSLHWADYTQTLCFSCKEPDDPVF